ncbi:MAG: DUF1207 domain-containing protein [Pirellulales bacterium]|nr:DUF1207 domain-containing protein [Pirellulales bacterium]
MHRSGASFIGLLLLLALAASGSSADESLIRAMPPSVVRPAVLDFPTSHDPDVPTSYPMVEPCNVWTWQVVPEGLMYRSYLAGVREPRIGIQLFDESGAGWLWDGSIGGRIGLLRFGTDDPIWPEGWQLDAEAGAFPRLTADEDGDLISTDFRYGFGLSQRRGSWESKQAFYHLSSHLGDEYQLTHPELNRINFSRFVIVLGGAFYPLDNVRVYGEAGYSFYCDGGTKPWEFQFGVDYSPLNPSGPWGAPFFAVNGHLRQEVDFGGNFTLQTGWQWRGATGRLARVGFHYFNGQSDQYQFFREHEQQVGVGFWYDF